ncbi:MAG TPA: hypothetical protein VHE34_05440 [Puia sp.]|uniref:hypothetical protein n=1 Tax=Puia sp. TaxID=2045100 RepID=UPI002B682654|nr:hypothetical protein [Puia sp.]HVU94644.1 hypothetical protein [Puia sp.]
MYTSIVNNQDQALAHLFFHCCLEDENFTLAEMDDLSAKLVILGLNTRINTRDELVSYRSYRAEIPDEQLYIRYLVSLIKPVNELALYSWCVELCIDDPALDAREEALLHKIAVELSLDNIDATVVRNCIAQRKAVELKKIF